MKIRSKLSLLAILPVILLLALTYLFVWASAAVERHNLKSTQADEVAKQVAELTVLTYEHHLYNEERAHLQWLEKYKALGRHVEDIALNFTSPEEREIVERFLRTYQNIGFLFEQHSHRSPPSTADDRERPRPTGEKQPFLSRITARIIQDLAVMAPAAEKLHQINHDQAEYLSRKIGKESFVLVGVVAMGLVVIAVMVIRAFTVPVRALQGAFIRAGGGDLGARVGSPSDDELGVLSRSFDDMADRLEASDSRLRQLNIELEQRVEARTQELSDTNDSLRLTLEQRLRAEQAVRRNEERLAALLELSQGTFPSWEALMHQTLEQAVGLSHSQVGYLHLYDQERQAINLLLWSSRVLGFCKAAKTQHYPLAEAGVWADSVRRRQVVVHNDYPALEDKKGYPEGHFPLLRHMSVPIFDGDRVVAVLGVGNKEAPYDDDDIRQLELFLRGAWDLIRRRQAEDLLRDSETRFRAIFDESPDGIVLLDIETGTMVDFNRAAHALLGYERDEFAQLNLADYSVGDGEGWWQRGAGDAHLELSSFETEQRGKSGEIHNVLVSAQSLVLGERRLLYAIFRDVTELRRAQEEVHFKAMLLDAASDSVFLVDPRDGGIVFANEAAYRSRGYTQEEMLSLSLADIDQPEFAACAEQRVGQVLEQGEAVFESGHLRKDGSAMPVEIHARRIEVKGEPMILSSVRDISLQKENEETLRRYAMSLERSNKELEHFAYVASHDLQEPLRKIGSFTELLARKYQANLDDKAAVYIGYIVDGAHRMQILINDLLSFSRVTTKGKPFTEVDCNQIVARVQRDLELAIGESGAVIRVGQLPTVLADDLQLGQVFQNLIGNALKYRHRDKPPEVWVAAKGERGEWVFSVRDNGIGISPQHFERVFQLFQRLHTREEYSGTGIGLALCKKIVERHGGRIWVESEPEVGSTFYFSIPSTPLA